MITRLVIMASVIAAASAGSFALRRYFRKGNTPDRFDRRDVKVDRPGPMLVEFTSPYCVDCQTALPVLEAASETHGAPLAVIDAAKRPDLARKYAVRSTPTVLVVDARGKVTTAWQNSPTPEEVSAALKAADGLVSAQA